MNIAVHAAELDETRVDGTRKYLSELLRRLGPLAPEHAWYLYHRRTFNRYLKPEIFRNYHDRVIPGAFHWTQIRFTWAVRRLRPERIFIPIQVLPYGLPDTARTVVTIHDLAFKYHPGTFPPRDARRLNWYTDQAVRRADRLIAITEATKRDLLETYPGLDGRKIRVIHHGFDPERFDPERQPGDRRIWSRYGLRSKGYVLYVGALQPRKNLLTLLAAFERAKATVPDMRLVIAGARAWLWEETEQAVARHPFRDDIVMTGGVRDEYLSTLYRGARVFSYPSLYEGFGLPILEAMASGVPVVAADNSSLPEVGGDAALYHDATDADALADKLVSVWTDAGLADRMRIAGLRRAGEFSWDRTARETLEWITE